METMKIEKRRDQILDLLKRYDSLRVSQLVKQLGVSDETIRNDLKVLSSQGLVTRNYGVASLSSKAVKEKSKIKAVDKRFTDESEIKNELATIAVSLLKERRGISIALDQGSTIAQIAKIISKFEGNNIFTSSLVALNNLKDSYSNIYCMGGKFNREDLSFQDTTGLESDLNSVHYDYSFLGSSGVLGRDGICSTSFADAQMKRKLIKQSSVNIAVIDAQKFKNSSLLKVASWSDLDYVVTNLAKDSKEYRDINQQTKVISSVEAHYETE